MPSEADAVRDEIAMLERHAAELGDSQEFNWQREQLIKRIDCLRLYRLLLLTPPT